MATMGIDYPILGEVSQPQCKWHIRFVEILSQSLVGFDQHILDNVRCIDTSSQRRVKPDAHGFP
jgi:hypothetical protein